MERRDVDLVADDIGDSAEEQMDVPAPTPSKACLRGAGGCASGKITDAKCYPCLHAGAASKYLGFFLHTKCVKAARSARRGDADAMGDMVTTSAEEWRALVSPGVTDDNRYRGS
eukprot:4567302-Pyramimonas_sp.AAC.1